MKLETDHPLWREFRSWCGRLGLTALPAHPWTVSVFLTHCRDRHPRTSPRSVLRLISRVHLAAGKPAPERSGLVRRTLAALENQKQYKPVRAALFPEKDFSGQDGQESTKAPPRTRRPSRRLSNRPRLRSVKAN